MQDVTQQQREALLKARCEWASSDPLYASYHDNEWGLPEHNDQKLFELLILEGAQAGLSWSTILRKREGYRKAFDHFDPKKVAEYDGVKVQQLLSDPAIVRNRLKLEAAIQNARALPAVLEECGSFDKYIWSFVGGAPKKNAWTTLQEIPAKTVESGAMSRDMAKRGFKFVGPTICYAFMQAAGLVNDHLVHCVRYNEVS